MNRLIDKKILFFFFAFALACFGVKTAASFPAPNIEHSINETLSDPAGHIPNAELEGLHLHLLARGHITVQKDIAQLHFSPAPALEKTVSAENLQIKASSLLIKDHLSHNYPSHNFW